MGKSFDPMLELIRRGAATVTCSQRSSASMSFSWLFPGGLLSSRIRLGFRAAVCGKLVLPVEAFLSNGVPCLNCLSHARGQAQIVPRPIT
jgi:hypothetical protein